MNKLLRFFKRFRKQDKYDFCVGTRFIERKSTYMAYTYRLVEIKEVHDLASGRPVKPVIMYGLVIESVHSTDPLVFWRTYASLVDNYFVFAYPADVEPEAGEVSDD